MTARRLKGRGILAAGLLLWPAIQYALDFQVGTLVGLRTVADPKIRAVYGNGRVYCPFFTVGLWRGLAAGLSYEEGYERSGKIGTYQEPTSLSVTGPELYLSYRLEAKFVSPYVRLGYGFYSYKQIIESPYTAGRAVDNKKSSPSFGGGLKLFPLKFLFLAVEIKYVPLKVKPFEEEVDLGGLRFLVGAGFRLTF